MHATIQKWGNSSAIRLPKAVLETANLERNSLVQVIAEPDRIIIKKADARKHRTFKERMAGFEGAYSANEWDTGAAIGDELW